MTNYAAAQPIVARGSNTVPRKRFHKNDDNHTIINNVVDEIILNEPKKVSAVNHEEPEVLKSDYNENYLYQVENIILGETKEMFWLT